MKTQLPRDRDPDSFDIKGSIASISRSARNHKALVLLTCLFTLGLVVAYIVFWPPVYTATAVIMVERDTDPVRDAFYTGWNNFRKDDSRTEIELITSTPVLTEVVRQEGLTYDEVYHPFASHLSYLWEKSWPGQKYHAFKQWLMPSRRPQLSEKEKDFIRTVVSLKAGIYIEVVPETNAGHVEVKGPSERVAAVANRIMDVYLAQRSLRFQKEATKSLDVLSEEVANSRVDLDRLERQRLAYTDKNALVFDFQKETLEISKLTDMQAELSTQRAKLATAEADLHEVNAQIAREPQNRETSTSTELNNMRENLKMKRFELQTKLSDFNERYRPDSPEVQETTRELARIDAQIAVEPDQIRRGSTQGLNAVYQELISKRNAYESDLVGARAGLAVLEQTEKQLRERLYSVPGMRTAMREMDRDVALAQDKYQQLVAKQEQASVSLATAKAAMPSMRLVEYAMPPTEVTWPKPKILIPSALFAGLLFGILAALIVDYSSDRVRKDNMERAPEPSDLFATVSVGTEHRPFTIVRRIKPGSEAQAG